MSSATNSRDPDDLRDRRQEVENLYKAWEGRVDVRGTYSTVGFRADADLMLWLVGRSPQDVQRFLVEFRAHTAPAASWTLTWTFMGVVKPAEFTPDHAARVREGRAAEDVPVRLPVRAHARVVPASREKSAARILREHGTRGASSPTSSANTTSAFGLGDWEWILAFEADEADRLVDCIRRLRDAKARLFTKEETPFITGIRKPVADAFDDFV